MITESQIYWITRLDGLKGYCEGVGFSIVVVCVAVLGFSCIARFADGKPEAVKYILPSGLGIILALCVVLGSIFIPTTKEMCVIKVIPIVANDETVQALPEKIDNLADEWIDELSPKENKE